MQIKLLRVLQERTFTPRRQPRDAALLRARHRRDQPAASASCAREGRFRDDFYYRLCSDVIEVPHAAPAHRRVARRARGAGAPAGRRASPATHARRWSPTVLEALQRDLPRGYAWPGNVRELEQAVRRDPAHRPLRAGAPPAATDEEALVEKLRAGELTADELLGALQRACSTAAWAPTPTVAKRTGLDPRTSRKYVRRRKKRIDARPALCRKMRSWKRSLDKARDLPRRARAASA